MWLFWFVFVKMDTWIYSISTTNLQKVSIID